MCYILCHLIWGIWRFHRWKDFEAMKGGKLAIWPWLSCRYTKNIRSWTRKKWTSYYPWEVELELARFFVIHFRTMCNICYKNLFKKCHNLRPKPFVISIWNSMDNFKLKSFQAQSTSKLHKTSSTPLQDHINSKAIS